MNSALRSISWSGRGSAGNNFVYHRSLILLRNLFVRAKPPEDPIRAWAPVTLTSASPQNSSRECVGWMTTPKPARRVAAMMRNRYQGRRTNRLRFRDHTSSKQPTRFAKAVHSSLPRRVKRYSPSGNRARIALAASSQRTKSPIPSSRTTRTCFGLCLRLIRPTTRSIGDRTASHQQKRGRNLSITRPSRLAGGSRRVGAREMGWAPTWR